MLSKVKGKINNLIEEYKIYVIPALILAVLIFLSYEYLFRYFYIFKSPENLKEFVVQREKYGVLIFLLFQVLQVVVFIIPGEVIQVAGGYIYGTLFGALLSIVGISIGSAISFLISNRFGKPFVKRIVSEKKIQYFENVLKTKNFNLMIFILYLIPGIPKDALAYICGISSISFREFATYSTLGRIPAIFVSAYFGAKMDVKDTDSLIIIGITMSLVFIIAILKRDHIIKYISNRKKKSK